MSSDAPDAPDAREVADTTASAAELVRATAADTYVRQEMAAAAELAIALAGDAALRAMVGAIAQTLIDAIQSGHKILLVGNGGSAADAQHLAAEFVGRFAYDRGGMPALALTTDTSALTAIANDYGFDRVFARQVEGLGVRGDVLLALSTSGRSPNVLQALATARALQLTTVGFTGRSGGDMAALCDLLLCVPADTSPHIQQGHMVIGHVVCGLVERAARPPLADAGLTKG